MMKGEGKQGAQEPKTLAPQGVRALMETKTKTIKPVIRIYIPEE